MAAFFCFPFAVEAELVVAEGAGVIGFGKGLLSLRWNGCINFELHGAICGGPVAAFSVFLLQLRQRRRWQQLWVYRSLILAP